jgi:potassium-dependent mechanosensitive channel
MKAMYFSTICRLLLTSPIVMLVFASPAWSSEVDYDETWLTSAKTTLESASKTVQATVGQELDAGYLEDIKNKLLPIREQAQNCVTQTEAAAQRRREDIHALGAKLSQEAADISRARNSLEQEREALEKQLASCQFILIQAKDIKEKVAAIEQATLTKTLLIKGPATRVLFQDTLNHPKVWWRLSQHFVTAQSGLQSLADADVMTLLVSMVLGLLMGRRFYQLWLTSKKPPCVDKCTGFMLALKSCSARLLPGIGASAATAMFLSLDLPVMPMPFITQLAYGLLIYVLIVGLIRAMLHPDLPARHYLTMAETTARVLAKHLQRLLALGLLGWLFFGSEFSAALLETQYWLARSVYGTFLFLNLVWVLWSIGRVPALDGTAKIRLLLLAVLTITLGAEWLGYRNLSVFTLIGLLGSLLGIGVVWFINTLMNDLFDGMDYGYQPWQTRLRQQLGLKDVEHIPGLIWLRLIASAALWSALALWILRVWGVSHQGIDLIMTFLQEGFWMGSFRMIPLQIASGLLSFSLLFALTGWFKQQVVSGWLSNARIERGARDALIIVTGYLGLIVSLLVSLSIAGVEFANLAIIAGALSVGIGFGLQNIVNNFISGLILLIERPIRTGDWILVGAIEGFVHKISIRSTQLRTFDGSHIIVPNSELIAGQVTNWMLHDSSGRIKIPVGVAYGSDLEKVKTILLTVAHQHDMVITDGKRVAAPLVLMMGFGDSALNLELRCFIRSIDNRAQVFSDLCFAINAAFRTQNIDIPFPQRDVHLKENAVFDG